MTDHTELAADVREFFMSHSCEHCGDDSMPCAAEIADLTAWLHARGWRKVPTCATCDGTGQIVTEGPEVTLDGGKVRGYPCPDCGAHPAPVVCTCKDRPFTCPMHSYPKPNNLQAFIAFVGKGGCPFPKDLSELSDAVTSFEAALTAQQEGK